MFLLKGVQVGTQLAALKLGQFAMPAGHLGKLARSCKNYVYFAPNKIVLSKCSFICNKGPVNIGNDRKAQK